MTRLSRLSAHKGQLFLTLFLMAIGMNAFIPAGFMVSPSEHGLSVTLCPETNSLARAVAASQEHSSADHAAMGHHVPDAQGEASGAAATGTDCAFSALVFAGDTPEPPTPLAITLEKDQAYTPAHKILAVSQARYLRPPLRGPPTRG